MQISELSKLIKVPASTIRDWEKYLELDIPRDQNGDRYYSPEWVEYFKQVKVLNEQGKSYDEIKDLLTPPVTPDPNQAIQEQLLELQNKTAQLRLDVTELGSEQGLFKTELGQVQGGLQSSVTEIETLRKLLKQVQEDNSLLQEQMSGLKQDSTGLKDDVVTLREQQTEQGQELVSLREEVVTLRKGYDEQHMAIVGLRDELQKLKDKPTQDNGSFWKTIVIVVVLMVFMGAGLANYVQSKIDELKPSSGYEFQR